MEEHIVFIINGCFCDDGEPWVRLEHVTDEELKVLVGIAAKNDSDLVIRCVDAEKS